MQRTDAKATQPEHLEQDRVDSNTVVAKEAGLGWSPNPEIAEQRSASQVRTDSENATDPAGHSASEARAPAKGADPKYTAGADKPSEAQPTVEARPEGADPVSDQDEPSLEELVKAGWRADAESNDRRVPRLSNRDRPPREDDVNYNVDVPHDWSQSITDVDLVKGGTLWEVKKVTGKDPRMDTDNPGKTVKVRWAE